MGWSMPIFKVTLEVSAPDKLAAISDVLYGQDNKTTGILHSTIDARLKRKSTKKKPCWISADYNTSVVEGVYYESKAQALRTVNWLKSRDKKAKIKHIYRIIEW